ncbi:unnamed protein product [Pleuronectes platessa]|uniref:Uncharacterized protein n=1 Tax=Pleuronectes platessa TaxID=8262 RepID=A0A9N7U5U7_PLEPL|nr:unnamed protein product [Pleuronectes platessa]
MFGFEIFNVSRTLVLHVNVCYTNMQKEENSCKDDINEAGVSGLCTCRPGETGHTLRQRYPLCLLHTYQNVAASTSCSGSEETVFLPSKTPKWTWCEPGDVGEEEEEEEEEEEGGRTKKEGGRTEGQWWGGGGRRGSSLSSLSRSGTQAPLLFTAQAENPGARFGPLQTP